MIFKLYLNDYTIHLDVIDTCENIKYCDLKIYDKKDTNHNEFNNYYGFKNSNKYIKESVINTANLLNI